MNSDTTQDEDPFEADRTIQRRAMLSKAGEHAVSGIKALFIANGGAAIAVLSLLGTLLDSSAPATSSGILRDSIYLFSWGVVASAAAYFMLCSLNIAWAVNQMRDLQYRHISSRMEPVIWTFLVLSVIAIIASLAFFLSGMQTAAASLL